MLGVKSTSGMAFSFYDWESLELVRRYSFEFFKLQALPSVIQFNF